MGTTVLTTPTTNVSEAKPHSPIDVIHTKNHMSPSDSHMTSIPLESDDEDMMLMEVFNTDKQK